MFHKFRMTFDMGENKGYRVTGMDRGHADDVHEQIQNDRYSGSVIVRGDNGTFRIDKQRLVDYSTDLGK